MKKRISKCLSIVISMCIAMAMSICLIPVNHAYAAGSTISNIRVETYDNNGNVIEFKPSATLAFDTTTFTLSDVKGEVRIYRQDNTYYGDDKNPDLEDDYDISMLFIPDVYCVQAGNLTVDTSHSALLTVPIPEGYDGSTAKVTRVYDMLNIDDYTKKPVTSFSDTTITVAVALKYIENQITDDNGDDVDVGGFTGHVEVEFKKKSDITPLKGNASVSPATNEYTGSAIEPTVKVGNLVKDKDFTVSYSNNTNVGTATATITGKNLYSGSFELPFTITAMPIEKKKDVAALSATEFEHTGSAITPEVKITGLTKDTDFTVAYANNIEPGTATATITGKGNYTGSFHLEYTIKKPAEVGDAVMAVEDNKGQDYTVISNGEKKEATYEAPKSKKETKINIPNNITLKDGTKVPVTKVAPDACKKNTKLKSATIGNNVRDVGDNAFNGCSNLTTLKFGKRVENIGKGAARNCKKLKKTTIPASTKKIGANAFNGDSSLANLTINCKNLKSVGNGAIKKINPKATITLKGSAKQKKAALKLITNKKTGYKGSMKIKK